MCSDLFNTHGNISKILFLPRLFTLRVSHIIRFFANVSAARPRDPLRCNMLAKTIDFVARRSGQMEPAVAIGGELTSSGPYLEMHF